MPVYMVVAMLIKFHGHFTSSIAIKWFHKTLTHNHWCTAGMTVKKKSVLVFFRSSINSFAFVSRARLKKISTFQMKFYYLFYKNKTKKKVTRMPKMVDDNWPHCCDKRE